MKTKKGLYWAIFIAALGSVLFGVNMAAISGAVSFIKDVFILNDTELGLVVSSMIAGCLIGAFTIGSISDKIGRRKALIIAAVLFTISALGSGAAQSSIHLMIARLIGGIAVGAVSVVVPTYISELTPPAIRGTMGTMNQLGIVVGILIAYVIDFCVVEMHEGWRLMLYSPIIFAVPFLLLTIISFPESPRWSVMKGDLISAKKVLNRIVDIEEAESELEEIQNSLKVSATNTTRVSLSDLFKGNMGKVLVIGILLAVFQQITGINAIIAYAPTIFEKTGVGGGTALLQSILVGIINFIFTLVAVWLIDKVGRKQLLLWGAAGMILFLSYITFSFYIGNVDGLGVFISILGFIAFFAASFAPVMWVVTSEIYPNKIRGLAMSVSTAISWVCTLLVVQFFPIMLGGMGGAFTFGFFLVFSVLAFLFTLIRIPETKGKSLEQIQEELGLVD